MFSTDSPTGVDRRAGIQGRISVITILARTKVAPHYVDTEGVVSTNIRALETLVPVQAQGGSSIETSLALAGPLLTGGVGQAVQGRAADGRQ